MDPNAFNEETYNTIANAELEMIDEANRNTLTPTSPPIHRFVPPTSPPPSPIPSSPVINTFYNSLASIETLDDAEDPTEELTESADEEGIRGINPYNPFGDAEYMENFHPKHEYYDTTEETIRKLVSHSCVHRPPSPTPHPYPCSQKHINAYTYLPPSYIEALHRNVTDGSELRQIIPKNSHFPLFEYNWNVQNFFNFGEDYRGDWGIPFRFRIVECTWSNKLLFLNLHRYIFEDPPRKGCMICDTTCLDLGVWGGGSFATSKSVEKKQARSAHQLTAFLCPNSTPENAHTLCYDCFEKQLTTPRSGKISNLHCPLCNVEVTHWIWFTNLESRIVNFTTTWKRLFYENLKNMILTDDLLFQKTRLSASRSVVLDLTQRLARKRRKVKEMQLSLKTASHLVAQSRREVLQYQARLFIMEQDLVFKNAIIDNRTSPVPSILRTPVTPKKRSRKHLKFENNNSNE